MVVKIIHCFKQCLPCETGLERLGSLQKVIQQAQAGDQFPDSDVEGAGEEEMLLDRDDDVS